MKYVKKYKMLLSIALYALFLLGPLARIDAQEDVYLKIADFSILIETSGDEIRLTCNDGCAWKQLSFISLIKNEPQAVDQYGIALLTKDLITKDSLHSNFLFTIKRTQDGVSLEGKAGTLWPSLTLDCAGGKCFRTIDEYGVTDHVKK
jgi:hypothetical protein